MKKRNKKQKNKKFKKTQLETVVFSVFKKSPSKSFNYKQLSKILRIRDVEIKSLLISILDSLSDSGKIKEVKRGSYKLCFFGKKIVGKVFSVSSSGVYIRPGESKNPIFVSHENSLFALKNDLVEVEVFFKRGDKEKGSITQTIKRNKNLFVGKIHSSRGFDFLIPDGNVPFDIFIRKKTPVKNLKNKKVLVEVVSWDSSKKNPEGKIVGVLGDSKSHDVEMTSILYQHDLNSTFSKEIENYARSISEKIPLSEIKKRVDFRKTPTFTIDPEDAKDYDDALSVKKLKNGNWEIGVHIADVGFYVKENDCLDKESLNRSTSVYLVDRVIPMLPEKLSNNICSLKQGVDRLCYSVILEMDSKCSVVSSEIKKSIIHSDKRFTYEEAQKIIDDKKGLFLEELSILHQFSKKMRVRRFNSGSINFDREEVRFVLDKQNNPVDVFFKKIIDTNHLIEEFMLLSNKVVAEKIGKPVVSSKKTKANSFIYRVHDYPDEEKIMSLSGLVRKFGYSINISSKNLSVSLNSLLKKISGNPEENMIKTLCVRSMSKAEYSINNIGHYGLNFKYYSHFTSPIRRYPDLIVHRLLDKYLSGEKSYDNNKLSEICRHCSEKEKSSSLAERDSIKYMQTKFLNDKIGHQFFGIISGVTEWGIYVELEKNKCEGLIKISSIKDGYYIFDKSTHSIISRNSNKKYQLGDKVKVKVINTDIENKQINFSLIN